MLFRSGETETVRIPCHTSIEAALASRDAIFAKIGLAVSYDVASGGGVHTYSIAGREMTPAEFVAASKAIQAVITEADPLLAVDTARWADPAGLLRPPFSLNHKRKYIEQYGAPRSVEIL